ncbi:hypothetical protein H9L01_04910 [Erysipelothrix inopinata]|uniref:Uncharacterized protein n=1 Tax=Erysipelothrix inopinata TaxID=225084 RepID=A0A7G9S1H4_9FIRM|nr:hypothetical protein [Erysipelothrix inopinata]QNN61699.1 hypothetical protein H9L01_04910 [Erysipelothrix inopinata]
MKTKTNFQMFFQLTGIFILMINGLLKSAFDNSNFWVVISNWIVYTYLFIAICLTIKYIHEGRKQK